MTKHYEKAFYKCSIMIVDIVDLYDIAHYEMAQ